MFVLSRICDEIRGVLTTPFPVTTHDYHNSVPKFSQKCIANRLKTREEGKSRGGRRREDPEDLFIISVYLNNGQCGPGRGT